MHNANERINAQKLTWESVGGLPTKGSVHFQEKQNPLLTIVNLKISYELPAILARLMKENILGGMVTNELQTNLDRFKKLVESSYMKNN